MTREWDRRTFLRRLGCAGLAGPTLATAACGFEERPREGAEGAELDEPIGEGLPVTRPLLLPWGEDAVHVVARLDEMPMAYVSMGRREVYVDYAFRDRSNWVLDAHISVSTGVWRIPLPGDPVAEPITPGDTIREFEELDIAEWDSGMEPAEGDFRIRRGRPVRVTIDFACIPMSATGDWLSGGPWDVLACAPGGDRACREDFLEIGSGTRQPTRGCAAEAVPTRFYSWVSRE